MDEINCALTALKKSTKGGKLSKTVDQLSIASKLLASGDAARIKEGLPVFRKYYYPLYRDHRSAALQYCAALLRYVQESKKLNDPEPTFWQTFLANLLAGVLDFLEHKETVKQSNKKGEIQQNVLEILFSPMSRFYFDSPSNDLQRLQGDILSTVYQILYQVTEGNAKVAAHVRGVISTGTLASTLLRIPEYLPTESFLSFLAQIIPPKKSDASKRERFIRQVFDDTKFPWGKEIFEDVKALTLEWDEIVVKIMAALAKVDIARPQPFEVFNLRLDGKEYPCVGPAYVDRNVFFVDYDVEGALETQAIDFAAISKLAVTLQSETRALVAFTLYGPLQSDERQTLRSNKENGLSSVSWEIEKENLERFEQVLKHRIIVFTFEFAKQSGRKISKAASEVDLAFQSTREDFSKPFAIQVEKLSQSWRAITPVGHHDEKRPHSKISSSLSGLLRSSPLQVGKATSGARTSLRLDQETLDHHIISPIKNTLPTRSTLKPAKRKIITLDSDSDFEPCDAQPSPTPVRAKPKSAGKPQRPQARARSETRKSAVDLGRATEALSTAQVAPVDGKPASRMTVDLQEVMKPQSEMQGNTIKQAKEARKQPKVEAGGRKRRASFKEREEERIVKRAKGNEGKPPQMQSVPDVIVIDDGIHEVAASEAMTKKGPKKTNHLPWMAPEVENRLRSEVTSEFAQEATDVTRLGQPSSEFQKFFTTDAPDAVDDTKQDDIRSLLTSHDAPAVAGIETSTPVQPRYKERQREPTPERSNTCIQPATRREVFAHRGGKAHALPISREGPLKLTNPVACMESKPPSDKRPFKNVESGLGPQPAVVDDLQRLPVPTRSPNRELDYARDRALMDLKNRPFIDQAPPSRPEAELQKLPVPKPLVPEDVPRLAGRHTDAHTERLMHPGTRSPRFQQSRANNDIHSPRRKPAFSRVRNYYTTPSVSRHRQARAYGEDGWTRSGDMDRCKDSQYAADYEDEVDGIDRATLRKRRPRASYDRDDRHYCDEPQDPTERIAEILNEINEVVLENITKPFINVRKEVRQAHSAISAQVVKKLKDMQIENTELYNGLIDARQGLQGYLSHVRKMDQGMADRLENIQATVQDIMRKNARSSLSNTPVSELLPARPAMFRSKTWSR